jgi:hypothetical protein
MVSKSSQRSDLLVLSPLNRDKAVVSSKLGPKDCHFPRSPSSKIVCCQIYIRVDIAILLVTECMEH